MRAAASDTTLSAAAVTGPVCAAGHPLSNSDDETACPRCYLDQLRLARQS